MALDEEDRDLRTEGARRWPDSEGLAEWPTHCHSGRATMAMPQWVRESEIERAPATDSRSGWPYCTVPALARQLFRSRFGLEEKSGLDVVVVVSA